MKESQTVSAAAGCQRQVPNRGVRLVRHRPRRRLSLSAILAVSVMAGCGAGPAREEAAAVDSEKLVTAKVSKELRIAAAADLQFALEAIIAAFEQRHPGADVKATYGSSGSLFAQLSNEAPFDLFLSADVDYPRRLGEQGCAAAGTEFTYATGHLVLWAPRDSKLGVERDGSDVLRKPSARKIAVANPKTAPYGRAAVAALKSLGLYDTVESRLVYGENVAQTAQMVESGSADMGIISLSLARSPALREKGDFWPVPGDAHPAIVQGGVTLKWARDPELAGQFREFLVSPEGAAVLKQFGFVPAGE